MIFERHHHSSNHDNEEPNLADKTGLIDDGYCIGQQQAAWPEPKFAAPFPLSQHRLPFLELTLLA